MGESVKSERAPSQPMNVQQIVALAQEIDYNPQIPLKYWLRSAGTILKEAEIYQREGDEQQTYLLLYRHAQLVVKYLTTSPESKSPQYRLAIAKAQRQANENLKRLEVLKPRINKRYERFQQLIKDRDARRIVVKSGPRNSRTTSPSRPAGEPSSPSAFSRPESLKAYENKDLAVKLAQKEIERRAIARKATRQAGITGDVEHERRTAGLWGDWETALVNDDTSLDRDTLSKQMQNVRLRVNGSSSNNQEDCAYHGSDTSKQHYTYPSVVRQSTSNRYTRTTGDTGPPEPPPKPSKILKSDITPPEIPDKKRFEDEGHNQTRSAASSVHESPAFAFQPSAYLENGTPLRTVFLPPDLRQQFLALASSNTRANLETCGILCGTLVSNALFISKLVIPDQECTSDTCETINEGELFDYVDGEDLMVLGWIHTHPTQTCFMSSRDLHTHGGYQVMMPESIAIVCAPSKGDWGVFRLTDPPGLKAILNCTQTGLFHPHSETHIYTDALRPGHVHEAKGLHFDVVDLRPAV